MRRKPSTAKYGIRPGYIARAEPVFFDDTGFRDEWQREVYARASMLCAAQRGELVYDVGCGSAYKLVQYFQGVRTVGFEIEPTLSWLRQTYPDHHWLLSDFDSLPAPADVVICSDVIEHIQDPNKLLRFLARITRYTLVLSTPDRLLLYGHDHCGPPNNPAHAREWMQDELRGYVEKYFRVVEQTITNRQQGTQMLICQPR